MRSKILNAIFSLFFIAALTHFMSLHLPGDPFSTDKPLRQETKAAIRAYYGLDDPFYIQFGKYLSNLMQGDLGYSLIYKGLTVNQLIKDNFTVSCTLGGAGLFLALSLGIAAGTLLSDRTLFFTSCLILSIPGFILATIFQYLLAIKWGLFPIARWEGLHSMILPAFSLALVPAAFIAKQVRENVLKIRDCDFMLLAKVKGLSHRRIFFVHLLPNVLIPLFGYFGQLAANILTGSFLIERIFAIPGLGFWFVSSILERDYPVILGLTFFYSFLLIFFSLLMEGLVRLLDVRVREKRYA